jgi:hypothetical protein
MHSAVSNVARTWDVQLAQETDRVVDKRKQESSSPSTPNPCICPSLESFLHLTFRARIKLQYGLTKHLDTKPPAFLGSERESSSQSDARMEHCRLVAIMEASIEILDVEGHMGT